MPHYFAFNLQTDPPENLLKGEQKSLLKFSVYNGVNQVRISTKDKGNLVKGWGNLVKAETST